MKLLVIGEPCVDIIHKADGKVYREHGGISYSITASGMLDDGIETIPVIGLAAGDREYFEELFNEMPSVNRSGIYRTNSPVRRVDLFYEDENARWECSTQPIEATPFERIEPFLDQVEGIHLNLIGGDDIELDTLARIRESAPDAHVHLDLHNIVMQRMPDGKRVRRPRRDYLEWSKYAETVQMNEDEANVIDAAVRSRAELAGKVLAAGPKALVISFADRGLSLYEKVNDEVTERFFPPRPAVVVDPTGSGDVFGATFLHGILLGKNYAKAAEDGVEMAVRKVGAAGPLGLLRVIRRGRND